MLAGQTGREPAGVKNIQEPTDLSTFSTLYLRPDEPQSDSPRMRLQLFGLMSELTDESRRQRICAMALRDSGINIYYSSSSMQTFFKTAEIRDVLDIVTYIFRVLRGINGSQAQAWVSRVQSVFNQQNLSYTVDGEGVVHYRVDAAHEALREAALRHLGRPRYGAVRAEFERSYLALSARDPDGKGAIRAIFGAVEILFKLMFPVARLGTPEIKRHLIPLIQTTYSGDEAAYQAASRVSEELEKWVTAAHYYRHEQGVEEPNPPPVELSVALLGTGTAHLRWLLDLDPAGAT